MAFQRDYTFGTSEEEKLLPKLAEFFNEPLRKTHKTCRWDYESDTTCYEMKSRKNTYSAYPTTLLPFDKITGEKKQVFLFNFTDGLYYIEYDPVLFETFEVKDFRRWRQGVNDLQKPYLYIPISKLVQI
jgi:hypothetical protein